MASSRITGTSENVSTYGNGTRDYTSLSTWESATDNDLVTSTTSEVLECYDDAAGFDDSIVIVGATTNTSYFRIIRPASGQGHDGTSNNGFYLNSTTVQDVINISENNFSLQDLIIGHNFNSAATRRSILNGNFDNISIIGCILTNQSNAGAGLARGIETNALATGQVIVNTLIEDADDIAFYARGSARLYNCVARGAGTGFFRNGTGTIAKNCLADNNSTADFTSTGWGAGTSNNASSDGTAPGTDSRTSQTFSFVNAAGNDFHLATNDTGAMNHGVDLSADADFAFDDDIDGDTFGTWDIGFDENGVAPPAVGGGEGGGLLLLGVGA